MANIFEITDTYIKQLEKYEDKTVPLLKILESSQNLLFRLYLARRTSKKEGFFEEELFPFIKVKYYVGNGRFTLFDLNPYKEGFHVDDTLPSSSICSSSVLDLLDDNNKLINDDELSHSLDSYPSFTDWFKRLLDKLPPSEREKISLDWVKIKKFQEALAEEKKKIENEVSLPKKEEVPPKDNVPVLKPKKSKEKMDETPKSLNKVAVFRNTDFEEKKLIASQNKAEELSKRIKKKIGIHFGWEEIFISGENSDEMLTLIDKKVRRRGLRKQDNDWIIVLTYTVEEDDYQAIKEHYEGHAFRSDDILHKPSPEFVSLAIVVSPKKGNKSEEDLGVKKVSSKGASFNNIVPESGYTIDENLLEDSEIEDVPERKINDGIIKKVKYKGAIFNNYSSPSTNSIPSDEEEDDIDEGGSFYNDNGEYGFDERPFEEEEEIVIPKHWKCPFCPSKNPWHTEEPSRIITKPDGSYIFLCKKHKNNHIG